MCKITLFTDDSFHDWLCSLYAMMNMLVPFQMQEYISGNGNWNQTTTIFQILNLVGVFLDGIAMVSMRYVQHRNALHAVQCIM